MVVAASEVAQLATCWPLVGAVVACAAGVATLAPKPAGIATSAGGAPAHVAGAAAAVVAGSVAGAPTSTPPPPSPPPSPPAVASATTPAPAAQRATTTA